MPRARPLEWRVKSGPEGGFDELVVHGRATTGPALIHAEMMDERSIFVSIGHLKVWAHVGRDGVARVTMTEGDTP
jgi:hypothetical protein